MTVVPLAAGHWPEVERIYAAGIATGHATFETEPPTWEQFDAGKLPGHRLVAVERRRVSAGSRLSASPTAACTPGWSSTRSTSTRPRAAAGSAGALLDALIASTEAAGIWTIQSGIFPENPASLALHRAAGFREVGIRERVGRMSYGPMAGSGATSCSSSGAASGSASAPAPARPA